MDKYKDLVEKYKSTVYGIALTRTRNIHDADDVFQEVFLTYFKKDRSFESEGHEKGWFIKTTIFCTLSFFRTFKQNILPLQEDLVSHFAFESSQDSLIYQEILKLPNSTRLVVYLYYVEGYSTPELATLLSLNESTVRMRLKRGRDQLKTTLKGAIDEN